MTKRNLRTRRDSEAMSDGLLERIMYDAAYNRDLLTQTYAGDLADLVTELQQRAERAEAALRMALDSKEFFRVCWEKAEAELAAVPWQALLNISHALAASDAANDPDEAALLSFLNRYAPWVPNESEE